MKTKAQLLKLKRSTLEKKYVDLRVELDRLCEANFEKLDFMSEVCSIGIPEYLKHKYLRVKRKVRLIPRELSKVQRDDKYYPKQEVKKLSNDELVDWFQILEGEIQSVTEEIASKRKELQAANQAAA